MSKPEEIPQTEMLSITVDGLEIKVPKGTNLIDAAEQAGIEIPHYCYHPSLSVAGNCRMCQVEVEGMPKLQIACNLGATQGMVIRTHQTSEKVKKAQHGTLEFLLINHPLDCTVCDAAGHCKLQDYYYEYNGKASRFAEEKVSKVKAEILGPEIVYDGERCILCTRCVRFCDEVTESSELGVFNRGDKSVIGTHPDRILDNPLSGTVADLCPVGALTHHRWRFNTRIWYTDQKNSVCPGCSTGCNVKVAIRDNQIVYVKGRRNLAVNKEWLCDEGRYGFNRFQAESRLVSPFLRKDETLAPASWEEALTFAAKLKASSSGDAAVFLSPMLTLEEIWLALEFAKKVMAITPASGELALQHVERELSAMEKILVSPDYAPNSRALSFFEFGTTSVNWRKELESGYRKLIDRVKSGKVKRVLFVGDFSLRDQDLDDTFVSGLLKSDVSVALTSRGLLRSKNGSREVEELLPVSMYCNVLLPARSVNEKNGVFVNRDLRLQRLRQLLDPPQGSFSDWTLIKRISNAAKVSLIPEEVIDDRGLFNEMLKHCDQFKGDQFKGLSLMKIGDLGEMMAIEDSP